ncbi:16S rRNA (cytosine(1402)-N(4))-methyltransferase RsmH [Skermania piniformis]|uniref:Ribosomal RNA small subunit methyltransferase H n=1 Tax=Skermania pinensis TaxID=39122 RepID=A0ABX8SFA6_9ACTN|nr:16S rRNA (cytosine(1402)-N(4))-methyltransferase RsmH [Skermania piniformis]QXQ15090.1 16S rRNA (cytosine(1402)-N(4))-methyltransferase RsmH [Skermania piniformis]
MACDPGAAASAERPRHVPVLLARADELLGPALQDCARPIFVDATVGLGGHAEHFLTTYPTLRLIGLDRDPAALASTAARLARFADRLTLVHTRYDGLTTALASAGLAGSDSVDAILFDLGVSSMQLDEAARGFAYAVDAPLDMRMDPNSGPTAADLLNTASRADLARILKEYGEERFAGRIAAAVVRRRAREPFVTSAALVELIYDSVPAATRRTGGHPAKRTFQALRVAVNAELESLRAALPAAVDALVIGGRLVVMSYQSLEDRVVKQELSRAATSRTPVGLPVELPGMGPELRLLTRGAERADAPEIERNPRSAPVRMRAAVRVARRTAA